MGRERVNPYLDYFDRTGTNEGEHTDMMIGESHLLPAGCVQGTLGHPIRTGEDPLHRPGSQRHTVTRAGRFASHLYCDRPHHGNTDEELTHWCQTYHYPPERKP